MNRLTHFGVTALLLLATPLTFGQPTFQVYSPGAVPGDYGPDQDTWLVTSSSFELWVLGAYHSNTYKLCRVKLLVSVPDGEQGTISITGLYGTADPVLITTGADRDPLLGDPSPSGYSAKSLFLPTGANFNNHYPLQDGVSDFLIYDIDGFSKIEAVDDYNADGGTITPTGSLGEIKEFAVQVSGFSWVHFDAYGLEKTTNGQIWRCSWEINPASHDVTYVPAPGALVLGGIGAVLVGWLRRRRTL